MKYRFRLVCAVILACMASAAVAADIDGEWIIENKDPKVKMVQTIFEFHAQGSVLTGCKLGYPDSETPIIDGKIKGDKISFTLKEYFGERTDRAITYMYTGKIEGDVIKFTVVALMGLGIPPNTKYVARRVVPASANK